MLRGMSRAMAAVVLVVAATAEDVALANSDGPSTEPVDATFNAEPVNAKTRTCEGEDGLYLEISGKFAGEIVSSDPRLSGSLEFTADALVNTVTGLGTFEGAFTIRQASGRPGARGIFFTVVTDVGLNHGFARGKLTGGGHGEEGGEDFFARFQSVVAADLSVTGTLGLGGADGDVRLPAVIQRGRCKGRWTQVP